MLNYGNLNDVEFEALCRDIMSRKLGKNLRRFAAGRDGGVDLTDDTVSKNIVVQVKHYQKSDIAALIRSLKKELPKVQDLNPEEYYICCSRELSPVQIKELRLHFGGYMQSDDHIITVFEIDDFLRQPENRDILAKNFKLWIESTGILEEALKNNIFVDSEALLANIDKDTKLFVRTKLFDEALRHLGQNRVLCLIGNPGVGKSITSKMLVLHYATQGYKVRYTTDITDITTLKRSLQSDSKAKEIILLDDCFGQAYFEMKSSQCTELTSLIQFVQARKNKVLILNSRITIFKEAQKRSLKLQQCEDNNQIDVVVLDLNTMSTLDRAKILYNHLTLKGMPLAYLDAIKLNQQYRKIIEHPNFNPRIIEFVCMPRRYRQIAPCDFFSFVYGHLNNPSQIWNDEYENNLRIEDRILLQTVYSMTTTSENLELVRQCFSRRIQQYPQIDKTVDPFLQSLERLMDGFVVIGENKGQMHISMVNPSVNDFFDSRLKCNPEERKDLLENICTIHQMWRLLPRKEIPKFTEGLLNSDRIDRFLFVNKIEKQTFILGGILNYKVCNKKYTQLLYSFLQSPHTVSRSSSALLPVAWEKELLNEHLWEFYKLEDFFCKSYNLTVVLNHLDFEEGVAFIQKLDGFVSASVHYQYIVQSQRWLNTEINKLCDADIDDYESDLDIDNALFWATDDEEIDPDELATELENNVVEIVLNKIEEAIHLLPKAIAIGIRRVKENDITVNYADQFAEDYIENMTEDAMTDHVSAQFHIGENDYKYDPIDAIFDR